MNGWLFSAGILSCAIGAIHSGLGEYLIFRHRKDFRGFPPLLGNEEITLGTIRATWHIATLLAAVPAALLFRFAFLAELGAKERFAVRVTAGSLLACAAVLFAGTRGKHPGWAGFLLAAGLCGMGL
ncbi:MAG: hypothetical protein AB1405_16380 [Bdellovibrionota bacterium]